MSGILVAFTLGSVRDKESLWLTVSFRYEIDCCSPAPQKSTLTSFTHHAVFVLGLEGTEFSKMTKTATL